MTTRGHTIYHDLFIKAPVESIYKAVSEPKHLENWWPKRCSGTPEIGEEYHLFFTKEYDWYGKVSQLTHNKHFYITMTQSDLDWNYTKFGFELKEEGDQVRVSFTHAGWPHCNEHFRVSSYCWAMLLNGLKQYVEKAIVVPFEERS